MILEGFVVHVKDVSESEFQKEVIEKSNEVPVLVDFWAEWCSPCKILGPVLERIAADYKGRFILAKVNVEENPKLSARYSVMSIPVVKLFKGGEIVNEFVGAIPADAVREWLEDSL
ncbi:MAG: thioredoxin [archaeon]|nr:thioredoxin [archaeon]